MYIICIMHTIKGNTVSKKSIIYIDTWIMYIKFFIISLDAMDHDDFSFGVITRGKTVINNFKTSSMAHVVLK